MVKNTNIIPNALALTNTRAELTAETNGETESSTTVTD